MSATETAGTAASGWNQATTNRRFWVGCWQGSIQHFYGFLLPHEEKSVRHLVQSLSAATGFKVHLITDDGNVLW